ncbi:MAG TPA: malate synthase A [Nitrososphaerales archaeon]|nr:malate synthase A [Nitrososphaerales archaeon]
MPTRLALEERVQIRGEILPRFDEILTSSALNFVSNLASRFSQRREELLLLRKKRQLEIENGSLPGFLKETRNIREASWKVSPAPMDLQDRRVEITGPSGDTKMVINAFNSGANTYMADFEDSQSPTWKETIQGQINLKDSINGNINYTSPEGKEYRLNQKTATLIVRPRGWHLLEKHVLLEGKPIPASIFDFALFFFHNSNKLIEKGSGPYFYLPKIESYLEARLWNDIFVASEEAFKLPRGTIKATVLIETILAAFQMDEILYELRDHSSGLNCGRWDYIFSFIKKFSSKPEFILPDRSQVTMDKAFLSAYVDLLIKTCHKRGAHAIGGMSAYIPIKNDEKANALAFDKVRQDKEREVRAGHDGTWVAHPGLVSLAKQVFDSEMNGVNQISRQREDVEVGIGNLLSIPSGEITESGIRTNISVGIQYLEAWLRGKGSVPLYNLMEDAATAEICRAQLWQWIRHKARTSDGSYVSEFLVRSLMAKELEKMRDQFGDTHFFGGQYMLASELFGRMTVAKEFPEFLTLEAYEHLLELEQNIRIDKK